MKVSNDGTAGDVGTDPAGDREADSATDREADSEGAVPADENAGADAPPPVSSSAHVGRNAPESATLVPAPSRCIFAARKQVRRATGR